MSQEIDDGTAGIQALGIFFEDLKKTVDQSSNMSGDVAQLLAQMLKRFSKTKDGPAWQKLEADAKFRDAWNQFDDIFCDVMIKFDEAQDAADAREKAGQEADPKLEAIQQRTKIEAQELKPLLDVLHPILPIVKIFTAKEVLQTVDITRIAQDMSPITANI
ncbi:MAG: hypothetical protein M1818_006567 [Claussenomyces sp. TS43310]|nr:MAG: hypothetical protein M1818_006567 [Claussenomyces sp. TS43310]